MFLVIVTHICKPDMVEAAIGRIDNNGRMMSEVPGFLFRHRTHAADSQLEIGTVTAWCDEAAYQRWLEVKRSLPDDGASPYESVTSARHLVVRSHAPKSSDAA